MDDATALPKRVRLNPHGKALRRQRIFARLRMGFAYSDIAREEGVTPRRIRQIVSEALQRQQADSDTDHAILQRARLEKALRLSAETVSAGEVGAIAPYLKVLAQLDRYQRATAPLVYDKAARENLLAKLNRIAAQLERATAAMAAGAANPGSDAAEAEKNPAQIADSPATA